jgi:Domain of unknown function (DUF3244)
MTLQLKFTMQPKFPLVCLLFAFFAINKSSAQSSASLDSRELTVQSPESFTIGHEDWTFYLDQESKMYYIDFEAISVNLSDIKVIDEQGEVVISDKLWDLPVNTIYELDFNKLQPGNYKIELRSYTGVISKDVKLSE